MSFIFKSEDIVTDIFPWEHIPFILQILTWRSSAPDTMRGMLGWKAAQFTPRSWPWDQSKRTQISFKPTTNFIHSTPTALYNTKIGSSFFLWHYNHILTSRTCFTTASEAPNRSTPEMPRTSVSTAPGDKFFFLRPGSNIYSPTHTGDRLQITQEHPHTGEGRERNNIKTATQKHICDIWQ